MALGMYPSHIKPQQLSSTLLIQAKGRGQQWGTAWVSYIVMAHCDHDQIPWPGPTWILILPSTVLPKLPGCSRLPLSYP